ncbi:dehydrogenase reductase sdr family member 4 [Fusarium acutatum]|uniref:Dehydrogenase reductase sdr family member 4 n=1 Tax=Fusarium acutatum TaxID=78861 RepID=A0A8H4NJ50_9HYPO|nr:dehydrogenase reductase sdr family member 4 [Fusarium acutatum]
MAATVAAARPALVIVPGNFSLPRFWSAIQRLVEDKGYPVEVVPLQSCREERIDPAPGLADDVGEAQSVLKKHIKEGKDVVMLMHSYGGMVGTEASRGLSRIERENAGLKGGITRLIFLAAIFAPPGKSSRGLYEANPGRYPRREGDYLVCDEETAMCFYSDLTKGERLPLAQDASKISQAARVFGDEQTYDGFHKLIPSSYILTKKDVLVPEAAQRQFISRLEENGDRPVPVFELDTAHSPHQTDPQLVVRTLDKILENDHGAE